jgi:hypothetical protein
MWATCDVTALRMLGPRVSAHVPPYRNFSRKPKSSNTAPRRQSKPTPHHTSQCRTNTSADSMATSHSTSAVSLSLSFVHTYYQLTNINPASTSHPQSAQHPSLFPKAAIPIQSSVMRRKRSSTPTPQRKTMAMAPMTRQKPSSG